MKGPSLHYDMRVLRQFCCDACGRIVQAPAWTTSRTCTCSDPPKFMRPLERPKTVSPDVSRFITPVDPADAIEEEDVDEVPYVPHVPIKPPPPARFANRRKLYDDTAVVSEANFGEGVSADAGDDSASNEDAADEFPPEINSNSSRPNDTPENRGSELRRPRRRQRGRGGSNDEDRSAETQQPTVLGNSDSLGTERPLRNERPSANQRPSRNERTPRSGRPPRKDRQGNDSSNRNQPGNRRPNDSNGPAASSDTRNVPQSTDDVRSKVSNSDDDHDVVFPDDAASEGVDSPSDPATLQGEGRPRRSRRRGRRRGLRPEGGGE